MMHSIATMLRNAKKWVLGNSTAKSSPKAASVKLGVESLTDRIVPTTLAPAAPSFTATAVSATQIDLAWNAVPGATAYVIDEVVNGAWREIGSVGGGTTSVTIDGLAFGTGYSFDVAAYNAFGETWGNPQYATTFALHLAPPAPSFSTWRVAGSGSEILLTWNPVYGATGYEVDELVNGTWQRIGNLGSGSTSLIVTGLTPGVTYYFTVGASNAAGVTWANDESIMPVLPTGVHIR